MVGGPFVCNRSVVVADGGNVCVDLKYIINVPIFAVSCELNSLNMDGCIRIVVVTTALLTYTVTARSYHSYQHNHRFERQHHGYESNHHGHWPNHQSGETPHDHHPRDFSHYSTEDFSHYPPRDSWESRQNVPQTQEDSNGDSEEICDNYPDSNEDSNSKSWGHDNFPPQSDEKYNFSMPWSWSKMQGNRIERSPQANNNRQPAPAGGGSTTPSPLAIILCMRTCQVTAEYNPVCGSNNVTYNNPGRLECAQNCGVVVTLQRKSTCGRPIPAVATLPPPPVQNPTAPPITNPTSPSQPITPTRFTNIDVNPGSTVDPGPNGFTLSQSVLESIFTTPGTEVDDIEETDVRHEKSSGNLFKLRNIMKPSVSAI